MILPRTARPRFHIDATILGLIALLIAAFALRVYRLDWDEGRLLHPDELHVVDVAATRIQFEWPPDFDNLFDPTHSKLNPRSDDPDTGFARQYAYGALPLLVTDLVATFMQSVTGTEWTSFFGHLHKVGRALSATFDTGTVLLIFFLARRLFDRRIALLSALIYALAPMTIQLAHFFTTDSWLTFFVTLTLLLCLRAAERDALAPFAFAGAAFGLALATKGSVIALGAVIAGAAAVVGFRQSRYGDTGAEAVAATIARMSLAGATALAAFALFEPYALVRPDVYLSQLDVQARIVRGSFDAAFTRQYVGTTPVVYQIEQLVKWGLGPVAGILCLVGLALWLRHAIQGRRFGHYVVLLWLAIQGLVVLLSQTKFLRYVSPLLPVLVIAGAFALESLRRRIEGRFGPRIALPLVAACLAGIAVWTAGFSSVYAAPHTRLEASRWIYEHVPNGRSIGVETWDEALPVPFGTGLTQWDFQYRTVPIELYFDRPPTTVADDLYHALSQSDYVVLASNRVERGVQRLPWRYPVQVRYYQALESGALGFELVAKFERDPGIGDLRLDDQSADESLLNYDHPEVRIFKKSSLIDRASYDGLMAQAADQKFQPTRDRPDSLLLDEPVGELPVVADARWSAGITGNSAIALLVWLALLVALHVIGLPLARIAFGGFADAGWSFARLIALLVAAYLVWIGASVHLISFRAIWAALALTVVAATWFLIGRFGLRRRISSAQRRTLWTGEAVFWLVFLVFLIYRWINPDSWHPYYGGEKPMEFAHLNAILRSAHFPPYDPWFAGGYINYYYYGLYLIAFCIKLTGIPSEIAFNLAQPTVMALLASAGFGVASTLGRGIVRRRTTGVAAGLAGVLLLVGIGNLEAITQVVRAFPHQLVPTFGGLTWQSSRVIPFAIDEFPYFTGLYADLHAHVVALPISVLVAGLCLAAAREYRSFAVALSDTPAARLARIEWAVRLGLLVLALGALFPTNAWDVPVYAALAVVSLFMASRAIASMAFRLAMTAALSAMVAGLAYLLYLPFHTHYVALFGSLERTHSPTAFWAFVDHLGGLLAIAGFGLVAGLLAWRPGRIRAVDGVVIGIAIVAALLGVAAVANGGRSPIPAWVNASLILAVALVFGISAVPPRTSSDRSEKFPFAVIGIGLVGAVIAIAADKDVLALMLVFAGPGVAVWLSGKSTAQQFTGALVAAAALVTGGIEIVFLADDLQGTVWYRMNTIFKFYNQVWVLLALAAAASIALLIERARLDGNVFASPNHSLGLIAPALPIEETSGAIEPPTATAPEPTLWARIGLVVTGILVLASFAYPLLATTPRLRERFANHPGPGTLNALDWMKYGTLQTPTRETISFADDLKAINWLNSHVDGSPVIAEASIGPYRCNGSRISIATGLPTIIGWERHETQQRYLEGLSDRVRDVKELYASTDPATKLEILHRYGVRYVVVGQLERLYPAISGNDCMPTNPTAGIAAFGSMVGTSLDVVFESGTTVIYRVQ